MLELGDDKAHVLAEDIAQALVGKSNVQNELIVINAPSTGANLIWKVALVESLEKCAICIQCGDGADIDAAAGQPLAHELCL